MARICVTIGAETTNEIISRIFQAELADLIEIRLDYRKDDLDFDKIRNKTNKPLIATNRIKNQNGMIEDAEKDRVKLLMIAAEAGFEYIDVDSCTKNLEKIVSELQKKGAIVIVSYHDFDRPMNIKQLEQKHKIISGTECDILKLIGWAFQYSDNLPYLVYNKRHPGNISFAMGEKGVPSRILAPLSGAAFTYASLDNGMEVAPGQIPLRELMETYRSIMT
jgi:3-dehydroquinate dehydratase type I